MPAYLRPRRGSYNYANAMLNRVDVLKEGEIFFELPSQGEGKGQGRLMMGDGSSDYESLKPFLAFDHNNIQPFLDTDYANSTSISNILSDIKPTHTLYNNLNKIKQALLNINIKLKSSDNKRYIFIGDSYANGSASGNGWIYRLVTMMGLSTTDYYQNSLGGKGFKEDGFLNLITDLSNSISDHNSITDIVVCGGANDIAVTDDSLASSIQSFIAYCTTTYPNATVHIGDVAASDNKNNVATQYFRTLQGYRKGAKGKNVHFLQNLQYWGHDRSLLSTDQIHPNDSGYDVLTLAIYQSLYDNYNAFYQDYDKRVVYNTTLYSVGASTINISIDNNITTLTSSISIDLIAKSGQVFDIRSDMIVGEINSKLICCPMSYWNRTWLPVHCYGSFEVGSTTYYEIINGAINIEGRYIIWHPKDPVLGTSGRYAYTKTFSIPMFTLTMPSMFC